MPNTPRSGPVSPPNAPQIPNSIYPPIPGIVLPQSLISTIPSPDISGMKWPWATPSAPGNANGAGVAIPGVSVTSFQHRPGSLPGSVNPQAISASDFAARYATWQARTTAWRTQLLNRFLNLRRNGPSSGTNAPFDAGLGGQ